MIETNDCIIIHTPKCGGTTLRKHLGGTAIHAPHDGVWGLTPQQRQKQIYVLTREARAWYLSFFQFCVETRRPWLDDFGIPAVADKATFRLFLRRATIDPPARHREVIPTTSARFDSFAYMRSRGRGFWSFWHEFMASDDLQACCIAPDVQFLPCGHPRLFPMVRENTSTPLLLEWDREMLDFLRADEEVAAMVARQTIR